VNTMRLLNTLLLASVLVTLTSSRVSGAPTEDNDDDYQTVTTFTSDKGDADGDGVPDHLDNDDDNDGIPDNQEDADGDGVPDHMDNDDDNDGIPDHQEDADGDGVPDHMDNDDDNDGIPDHQEDADGDGVPDHMDNDDDNDGIPDNQEDADGDGVPDHMDNDDDNDGIPDNQEDADGDGVPDHMDNDDDNDGIPDDQEDADGDGVPDHMDNDDDNDGIPDNQEDADGDGVPDHLDNDDDNDGIPDDQDKSIEEILAGGSVYEGINFKVNRKHFPAEDKDGDGIPDSEDNDDDGDGVPDNMDNDDDNDGIPDDQEDNDGDGVPDHEDNDDDNDGIPDDQEDEFSQYPYRKYQKWRSGGPRGGRWPQHHLYVIIIGGLRWDFLEGRTHNLTSFQYLMEHGTTVNRVKPVFPTEDFPVWTSFATGRYPEDHGITGDMMYNLRTKEFFNRSDPESRRQENWWKKTDPFWSTAAVKDKKVSFFNWHDCQVPGKALEKPSDCVPHTFVPGANPSKQAAARQFDQAFTKLHKDKYDISVVYTDLVRRAAEKFGPQSRQLLKALHDVDDILQAKLLDIRNKKNVHDLKMNLMVISDYGVAEMDDKEDVLLEDYLDLDDVQHIVYTPGYVAITPFALRHDKILLATAEMPGVDSYLTSQVQDPPIWHGVPVPENLHFGQGEWSTDILLTAQPGFRFMTNLQDPKVVPVNGLPDSMVEGGTGFNPEPEEIIYPKLKKGQRLTPEINATREDWRLYHKYKHDMHTQAFFMGPDFKSHHVISEEVEIVDLYQIVCFLLDIPTSDNHEGSWNRVKDMLTISGSPRSVMGSWTQVMAATLLALLVNSRF